MPGCMFGTGADFNGNILQSKHCLRKYLIKCQRLTANTLLLERLVDGISKTQILFLDILYSVFIFHKSRHRRLDTTDNS